MKQKNAWNVSKAGYDWKRWFIIEYLMFLIMQVIIPWLISYNTHKIYIWFENELIQV